MACNGFLIPQNNKSKDVLEVQELAVPSLIYSIVNSKNLELNPAHFPLLIAILERKVIYLCQIERGNKLEEVFTSNYRYYYPSQAFTAQKRLIFQTCYLRHNTLL